jgi:hypothetical protein
MNALTQVPGTGDASLIGSDRGHAEIEKARALVERLGAAGRRSTAELLHELRRAFPDAPLAVRVRALDVLRRI